MPKFNQVIVDNFNLSYDNNILIKDCMFKIINGHRYALLGKNGTGKSSLLTKLSGNKDHILPSHLVVSHVLQDLNDLELSNDNTIDTLLNIVQNKRLNSICNESNDIENELDELIDNNDGDNNNDRIEYLSERLGEIEEIKARFQRDKLLILAKKVLLGLGFTKKFARCPSNTLSGGWKMRLALAIALIEQPDILLLDEPTNHLDLNGVLWLEQFLLSENAPKCMIIVSHDRTFVDRICTDIIVIESHMLRYFSGTFSAFEEYEYQAAKRHASLLDARIRQEEKAREAISKMKKGATSDTNLKQAKQKEAKIQRMGLYRNDGKRYKLFSLEKLSAKCIRLPERVEEQQMSKAETFRFPNPGSLRSNSDMNEPVIRLENVSCGYKESILDNIDLQLSLNSRIAVVGDNGAGELQPIKGNIWRHEHLRVASVHQHHTEQLNDFLSLSPTKYLVNKYHCNDLKARTALGKFGIKGKTALLEMRKLSGGQLARVSLTSITWNEPHMLIMDEPTNHLDIYALDALGSALSKYEGGVVLVSHNRAFAGAFCRKLWVVENGKVIEKHGRDDEDDQEKRFEELFTEYESSVISKMDNKSKLMLQRLQTKSNKAATKLSNAANNQKKKSRGKVKGNVSRSLML